MLRGLSVLAISLTFLAGSPLPAQVTYNNQIVRIVQEQCQTCHRSGNIAPFPLMTYEDARSRASGILSAVERRTMPPWPPGRVHRLFAGERILTDEQIADIRAWVESGAPEGVPTDLPEPVRFNDGWVLGEPDRVIQPDEFYQPVGPKADVHRCFVVSPDAREDLWIRGLEVAPGNRSIVHHVLLFVDESGQSVQRDIDEKGPGYTCFGGPGVPVSGALGGWVPGLRPQMFPAGKGVKIPAGAKVVMQVHYNIGSHLLLPPADAVHAHGTDDHSPDRTRVGLHLSDKPFDRTILYLPIANTRFEIPAGHPSYPVTASLLLPIDFTLHAIAPHMHLLGKEARVEIQPPGGEWSTLIHIASWDFNWQGTYSYKEPVRVPAFSRIRVTSIYDNSEDNPANPTRPPVAVRWGEGTSDEMCLVFLAVTIDDPFLARFFR